VKIALLVEGKTETAIKPVLKRFLDERYESEGKPRVGLTTRSLDTRLLQPKTVRKLVESNLARADVTGVVALIDIVSAGRPMKFKTAKEAVLFLQNCAPNAGPMYRAHAAQHDFEAWLLPYWDGTCRRLGRQKASPGGEPEKVDHGKPPSKHLSELYRLAGRRYDKPRDALAVLRDQDLTISARACPQFKAFLNSLLD